VPEDVLAHAGEKGPGAPVLVWIYGGGYTGGNKNNNPAGLLSASNSSSDGNVIYVALNYRLGALGFSSGPSFQAEGGVANAALHDQRYALEWIQNYIHLFGGDPKQVTVFGESAGGGSIMHQITAYGGSKGPVPFQKAIPQSPGWIPNQSQLQQEQTYQQLLKLTNSTCLEDLRKLSSEDIIKANWLQIYSSPYGSFSYGPVVDGAFVPAHPPQLLAQGRFDKSVNVMVGHNDNEGAYFTPPWVDDNEDFAQVLKSAVPYVPQPSLDYVTNVLYPPTFNGSQPYTNQLERANLLVSESIFTCNTYYLAHGFQNRTYAYLFSVPPAFHGFDVAYTYYEGGAPGNTPLGVVNTTVAVALQDWITSFAITGKPQADGVMEFKLYGDDANVMELDLDGIDSVMDRNANERCKWWQKGLLS
jgi:carboxylesterase type B